MQKHIKTQKALHACLMTMAKQTLLNCYEKKQEIIVNYTNEEYSS